MKRKFRRDLIEGVGIVAIVGSLIFVGMEVQQNTTQIRAEASYSINEALSVLNSAIYNDPVFADILMRGEKEFFSLNPTEQRQFNAYQYDRINLARHISILEDEGLSEVHFPYHDRLVMDFHRSPGLQEFLVFVDDEWVGDREFYERLRTRDE